MPNADADRTSPLHDLIRKTIPSPAQRQVIATLVDQLADCTEPDAAVAALRDFLPNVTLNTTHARAACIAAAHVIHGLGHTRISAADLIEVRDDLDDDATAAQDALIEAIDDGLAHGAVTPLKAATPPPTEAKPKVDRSAIIKAAINKYTNDGDDGAIFEREIVDHADLLSQENPGEYIRIVAAVTRGTDKGTATRWEKAVRAAHRGRTTQAKPSTAGESVETLAMEGIKLYSKPFTDASGTAYVVTTEEGPQKVFKVDSEAFKRWWMHRLYMGYEKQTNKQQELMVMALTRAMATAANDVREVHLRVASVGGKHYIDLCDDGWRVVEIEAGAWRVLDKSPVMFVRGSTARALPEPDVSGDVQALWLSANVHKHDRTKVIAWLCSTLQTGETYPILAISTRPGTGKSSTTEFLRMMFDPSKVNRRLTPKNPNDLLVAALNNYGVVCDNIDTLSNTHQDTLCVIATGTSLGGRELYSNFNEASSEMIRRPIILNGVKSFVTRQDLNSRAIVLSLPPFTESRLDAEMMRAFLDNWASAFGGLLNVYADALTLLPDVITEHRGSSQPRMVAYAYLGEAVSRVLGGKPNAFLSDFKEEQSDKDAAMAADDPVGRAICEALHRQKSVNGVRTYVEFCQVMQTKLNRDMNAPEGWPRSPKGFADRVRYLEQSFSALGIEVEYMPRHKAGNRISFTLHDKRHQEWFEHSRQRQQSRELVSDEKPSAEPVDAKPVGDEPVATPTTIRLLRTQRAAIAEEAKRLGVKSNPYVYH